MKDGTMYASRLKTAYNKLRRRVGRVEYEDVEDPLRQLAVSIFHPCVSEDRANRALDRVLSRMVDWNEVRVSTPVQLQAASGLSGDGVRECCKALIRALQAIYDRENRVSLDHLKRLPRREARQYLDELDGVGDYAVASVFLWSLGGHAIPLDAGVYRALQAEELVHPEADEKTVQAFLERNVAAADAKEFSVVIQAMSGGKSGRRRSRRVPKAKKPRTRKRRSASSKSASK